MVVVIQCKDQVGLVAAISAVLAGHGLNIVSIRENVDAERGLFFARLVVEGDATPLLSEELRLVLPGGATIHVNPEPLKKVAVLVTKEYHCLGDILLRNHFGTLSATVQCVIGNHAFLGDICHRFSIPFRMVSHEGKEKAAFEAALLSVLEDYDFDYIVLAKFMRILSPAFVERYPHRVINIHHSFLPAFVGASPYRQAFERGVKLIGATAHFVTNDLDEGPIIAQQIIPVNHTFTPIDMVRAGKEIETSVLARALQLVFEDRVFISGNKTIVFE
ncbi:formyltetrahydrofolate deformylase [Dinghuibacter silviterrae]|uniref:Formyltetrahydrofolate deformylase n=1 Tax=Dinghuibacter silviterrae TaxID=1539049 RepID=A0A4R8DU58_9BACT|nr:formyltetrahydrofolate deformylase [Dinghuibacter silviterrae]TDX00985.1 formyltetrahydrofolate deformylase [Dinghuibacter silviterrae]